MLTLWFGWRVSHFTLGVALLATVVPIGLGSSGTIRKSGARRPFFVCGYTSNGMVLTHFMPHALEHGLHRAPGVDGARRMGAMNGVGTITSGWIYDRFGRRGPLATYDFVRGLSLLLLLNVSSVSSLDLCGRRSSA
jgi:hypothetical protein